VTDDNTTLEFCGHLYSEPVVRRSDDGTVTLEWVHRGRTGTTLVSDPLIEEWVDTINAKVAAEAEVVSLRERLQQAEAEIAKSVQDARHAARRIGSANRHVVELETALRGLANVVSDYAASRAAWASVIERLFAARRVLGDTKEDQ
jgi:Mg2+ and Co2+ transporter CorA